MDAKVILKVSEVQVSKSHCKCDLKALWVKACVPGPGSFTLQDLGRFLAPRGGSGHRGMKRRLLPATRGLLRGFGGVAESVLARMVSLVKIHLKLHSAWWCSSPARLCGELLGEPISSCACFQAHLSVEKSEDEAQRLRKKRAQCLSLEGSDN